MCVCVCVVVCVTTQCQCGLNLQAYWIWLQQLGTSIHGYQKSLYDTQQVKISTCVLCVCVCTCVCVRVKSQSQCGFYLQAYCIWLGKTNQALLSRSIYPQCTQSTSMYGHQMSLLNNSTCVCVCVCVCTCVCVRVKSWVLFASLLDMAGEKLTRHCYLDQSTQCTQVNLHVWASNELVK